eukprot:c25469_g1_i1 orf=359-1033(-)
MAQSLQGLQDAGSVVATLVNYDGPNVKSTCKTWARFGLNLSLQSATVWMNSVICGFYSMESNIFRQAPVQDAIAPPPVKTDCRRLVPRTFAYKTRRIKRRSQSGGDGDDFPDWDEGGFGGSGGWGGRDNGGGGGDFWGGSWNDETWHWGEASDAALNLLYKVACWISLSQCIHFSLKRILRFSQDGVNDSPAATDAFAQCSSFLYGDDIQMLQPRPMRNLLKTN